MISPVIFAAAIFLATVVLLIWRPRHLNEAVPPAIGALAIYCLGIVNVADLKYVFGTVTGASITIVSTIIMSIVLESMGFFRWVAFNLVAKCAGSGIRLYWSVILLCFLMTMFFNNDGSIVITTPIIIEIVRVLELNPRQKFAYLCSGAIIATASSAPIGVSNLANLIALKIVNLDLVTYAKFMFVPSLAGLSLISILLYFYFRKDIPGHITTFPRACILLYKMTLASYAGPPLPRPPLPPPPPHTHPPQSPQDDDSLTSINWAMFRVYLTVIVLVRVCFFILSNYGIPIEGVAVLGALIIVTIRWWTQGIGPRDVIRKTPWHIFVFAFGMYVVVYGLYNVRLTDFIIEFIKQPVTAGLSTAILTMGILLTIMSNLFNNLPSVMIGTIIITQMGLEQQYLHVAYLANILGSDIGSLILPSGTLASLIWMFILDKHGIPVTWGQYIRATIFIIPLGLLASLLSLYLWVLLLS